MERTGLEQIKEVLLKQRNIQIDEAIKLPNAYLLKSYQPLRRNPILKELRAILVETNHGDQNQNENEMNSSINRILSENLIEVKQLLFTHEFAFKESTQMLQEINQWRIEVFQEKEGVYHILVLVTQVFAIVQKLWNEQQCTIDLSIKNMAINEQQNVVFYNQASITDPQLDNLAKLSQCILNYGSFLCSVFQNCNSYLDTSQTSTQIILRNVCSLIENIFESKHKNFEDIEKQIYELLVTCMLASTSIDNCFAEEFQNYKEKRMQGEAKNDHQFKSYINERDIRFDFKKAKSIEKSCLQNIENNTDVINSYLILQSIQSRHYRNYPKSIEYLKSATRINPYDLDILLGFIMIFVQKRQSEHYQVIRLTLLALSYIYEDYWLIYYLISWMYDRDCMRKESQYFIEKTKKYNNEDPQVISLDAIIHLCQKHNDLSLQLIERSLTKNHLNYPIVFFRKGYILDDLEAEDSLQWYEKSLEVDPYAADIYFNIAYYYSDKENIDQSIAFYQKCIEIDPFYVNAYLNQENNYSRLQDFKKQEQCLEKAIEIDPTNYKAYLNLGVCYEQQQKIQEAIKQWKKAIELQPSHPDAYGLIAYREYTLDNLASSIWYYKKYNKYSRSNEKEAIFSLSVLHQMNNDKEESEINALIYSMTATNLNDINSVTNNLYAQDDDPELLEIEDDEQSSEDSEANENDDNDVANEIDDNEWEDDSEKSSLEVVDVDIE